jgi:hypothetical protein
MIVMMRLIIQRQHVLHDYCNAQYHFLESIGEHDSFKAGARIWQNLEDCIMNEDISVTILPQVENYQNEISLIFAGLHRPNCNPGDHEYWRNICVSKINELVKTEKDVRDKLFLLETAFMFAGKVLSGTGQMPMEILDRKNNHVP